MSQNGSLSNSSSNYSTNSSSKSPLNSSSSTVSNNALQQRDELHAAIWRIADDVRGAIDGWDFKQYVLCTLFYRFISEHFVSYIDPDGSYDYIHLNDDAVDAEAIDMAVRAKGYFIRPSHLFANVVANAAQNANLNTDLSAVFHAIEASAVGYDSEPAIKGLFADFDTTSSRLGATVEDKNRRLAAVLNGVASLNLSNFADSEIDLFGDAYEYLINNYAQNAGKSGGEFFTPQQVSKLLARIAIHGQERINKIYDPACGSGSLLLQAKKQFDSHLIEEGFFGQEINHTTYNLARMNMFLHAINYDKFHISLGDTLLNPDFKTDRPFDAIVSNPPYSVKWEGSSNPLLINDERFAPAGVLAPKNKADLSFVLHALNYLSSKGRAAIVCFPGIFYRGGAEQKIRKYLVDQNFVEAVIALPAGLFYGTSIATNILVLSKHKRDTRVQFIDASTADFYQKATNNNVLTDAHVDKMFSLFANEAEEQHVSHFASYEDIVAADYNLSVSTYVEARDLREKIDIDQLENRLTEVVARITELRAELDDIVKSLRSA
jgi:hypothetical protein